MMSTRSQFHAALSRLLPPGWAFPRHADSVVQRVVFALAALLGDWKDWADEAVRQGWPHHTCTRLEEWEKALGLPDVCLGPEPTVDARLAAVLSKLVSPSAGLSYSDSSTASIGYLEAIAAAAGYDISITVNHPFRVGDRVGQRLGKSGTMYIVVTTATGRECDYFRVGLHRVGRRLYACGNPEIECLMDRIAPARYHLEFTYL